MGALLRVRSVAGQVFILQIVIVVLLIGAALATLLLASRQDVMQEARHRASAVAVTFAQAPGVAEAMAGPNPTALLQPGAEAIRRDSGVDAVVAFSPTGIRYTDPDPALIGRHVLGPGRLDRPTTQTLASAEGLSAVSVQPVTAPGGKVVGGVAVGITVTDVNRAASRQLPVLYGAAAGALVLAITGSVLESRRLRRHTHGLGPAEMTRMYEHHDAVLHAVREGVLVISGDGRLQLANDEARRLLELPRDAERRDIHDLGLPPRIAEVLAGGHPVTDEVHPVGERLLAVNVRPTDSDGGPAWSVATLRDTTELSTLAGRAAEARTRLQLLYDAGVRIGTTLDVVRTAEELAQVTVPRFADYGTVELADGVVEGEEPAGTEAMRRTAVRGIRADPPFAPVGASMTWLRGTPSAAALASGRAVLVADLSAETGWQAQSPEAARRILDQGIRSLITVPLRARGVTLGMADFWRAGDREPYEEEDLAFVEELAARAAVSIDNARRYTREHATAVALQRSLLPRRLPEQDALDVAYRYLPAEAGVGGDWFDVIPMPGARVALVVGDVVGHGLHAAATMGRLRTAVRNFSALDQSPGELLGHLDELVVQLDQEEPGGGPEGASIAGIAGATCVYAIYDPASGRCELARAGHPPPALVRPDGTVDLPEVAAGPPLGIGGLPFETAELHLAEGTQLALYTNGLIEDRVRDIGASLELLCRALAHPRRDPELACQAVLDTMLPTRPTDDVALLVARTRLLSSEQVADWDVPHTPEAVPQVRAEVARQLRRWDLVHVEFPTELVLSELVTNAVRYGSPPIHVRLLHDRALICEVSDGSSTAPHLRHASATDEGGRGLFLVAHLAERWGTRYTDHGKVIWAEQSLQDGGEAVAATEEDLLDQWADEAM